MSDIHTAIFRACNELGVKPMDKFRGTNLTYADYVVAVDTLKRLYRFAERNNALITLDEVDNLEEFVEALYDRG